MVTNKQGSNNMPRNESEILIEQYNQVSNSIKSVFDLTSRIDERLKMLIERQNGSDEQSNKILELFQKVVHRIVALESQDVSHVKVDLNEINKKVAIMESSVTKYDIEDMKQKIHTLDLKVETINMRTDSQEGRWAVIFDLAFKLTIMLIGGYLLVKFGWQAPP